MGSPSGSHIMTAALWIGLAGMFGALLRFGIDAWLAVGGRFAAGRPRHFPLATLLVNAVGSFVIGLAGGLSLNAQISAEWHAVIATGLAGGLTTFSSFTVATVALWQQGRRAAAIGNIALNVGVGLTLAWLGLVLAG